MALATGVLVGGGLLTFKRGGWPGGSPQGSSVIPIPPPADLQRLEQLAFWDIDLVQKEGSRLIYVLARVLNEASERRYGVRVEFELRDGAGKAVATATDYIETLDPNEDTQVKALVVDREAQIAVVRGISEQ
jgi:hypothetical protein